MANKAINELWDSYKEARKERAGKLLPKVTKKTMSEMSVRDLAGLVIDTILGKDPDMDKPIKEFTNDEWERFGNRMEKRALTIQKELGFEELPEEQN